jgi:radical SAM/Cys-rich protein
MIITKQPTSHFADVLEQHHLQLQRHAISTLQVNIGKRCNQACHHCHVEAGPERTENMTLDTIQRLLLLLDNTATIKTVDITGGAPELNPHFRYFVEQLTARKLKVIDRCNLTILGEPGQQDTAAFLARHNVQIIASLPCYLEDNVNKQRGKDVFSKSIAALQQLNALGYGKENTSLQLNLVYNPTGIHLPPAQAKLQEDYKAHLQQHFGITFNQLFTITNMPIKRFAHQLQREGRYDEYMNLLVNSFNARAAEQVMCKDMLSVGWNGKLYDCDFNQMLEMPVSDNDNIFSIQSFADVTNAIVVGNHCFGCTAGSGSSCGGSLA